MADRLTKEQRSALMGRVRQKDTAPELALRSALHRRGLRFRKNVKGLPGSPDIVFVKAKLAVFVDGDFWHGRDFDTWKEKLQPFWRAKIERNIERDARNVEDLEALGWRVVRVWEKEIKKEKDSVVDKVAGALKP
ncbi:very short patch repair endonuclease [Deinococcus alpinitundrae]|uniref:very short patch repair endonuclease n=1 Tax=Deinococcus alpinitundrae TaxID=468913 RepID=UPI001ED90BBC|nr:very short patch repair endonuclease [Deinococcus alpinitundrae]